MSRGSQQLQSWKEIASHLRRTVRTVQRWELTCGMPVHRHGHKKSSSVYAFVHELNDWWAKRQLPKKSGATSRSDATRSQFRCMVRWGRHFVPLTSGENLIGRSSHAAIRVSSREVSQRHARIIVSDEDALLEDLGSRNGTFIDDKLIEAPVPLKHLSQIRVGPALLIFYVAGDDATTGSTEPC